MKRIFYQVGALLVTIFATSVGSINAQTYKCLGHGIGCNRSATQIAAAINNVEILKDGVSIYRKPGDGCNGGVLDYNIISTSPSFTLYSGETYEVKWDYTSNWGNTHNFVGFVDYNIDGDYMDVNEHISAEWGVGTGVQVIQNYRSNGKYSQTFTVPCNITEGVSRMRFRSNIEAGFGFDNEATASEVAASGYGETEEYTIRLSNPSIILSSFSVPLELYAGTDITLVSTGTGSSSWDLNDDGTIDGYGEEFTRSYTAGTYTMKNIATSVCIGKDSSYKKFTIINPSQPTITDFVSDRTVAVLYDEVKLFDLSQFGPTNWSWHLYDSTQFPPVDLTEADRSSGTKKNPIFEFYESGTYTVCLKTFNIFGWSASKCKKDYIVIEDFNEYDVVSSWPVLTTRKGTMYDKGGRYNNYEKNASKFTNFLTVIPCDAGAIDITFTQFKMADENDKVFVFDGTDVNAPPLHPAGGFTASKYNGKAPFKVKATSGAFFIYYVSDGSGEDSGFVATWSAEKGNGLGPVASFKTPSDPLYNSVETKFTSTSQNVLGVTTYEWLIDNRTYFTQDVKHTFYSDGTYPVRLIVKTCLGLDTIVKSMTVITPQDKVNIDFVASNERPEMGELVKITLINDKGNDFVWDIFPLDFSYENGTNKYSAEPEIKLNKTGCYTFTLTALNTVNPGPTKRTIVKDYYVCVIGYCTPSADIITKDMSISNVKLLDGTKPLIDNSSGAAVGGYSNFTEDVSANVFFGKEYSISMTRPTNVDDWNGKVWIDWNIDGTFDDATESVLTEGASNGDNFTVKFRVPNYKNALVGVSRMRVACGYKGNVPGPCANIKIGEYEDYTINIGKDFDSPYITLTEPTFYVMQVNKTGIKSYVEPGYVGIDPSEGDITANVIVDDSQLDEAVTGYYVIRYNVCDQSGNCAEEVTRRVKVVDDITAPIITLANPLVNVSVSEKRACLGTLNTYTFDYSTIGATANDPEDGDLTNLISYDPNSVNMSVVGTYTIVYTVGDIQGNRDTAIATVNVQDLVAPDIVLNGPDNIPMGLTWKDQTWACDKYDANPVLVVIPGVNGLPNVSIKGDYPVTYKAYDASGNTAVTVVRNYRVDDFTAPVIDLHTNDTVYHDVNTKYYSVNATAKDNISKQVNAIRTGIVDWHTVGVYQEVYTAKDESNNTATKNRFVHVVDREAPQITGSSLCVKLGYEFWNRTGLTIFDNYDDPMDLLEKVEIVTSNVNVHETGVYGISYRVTDNSGNQSAIYNRVITVSEGCEEVSVKDLSLDDNIKVYPIPTGGKLNIDVNLSGSKVNATVVNLLGAVVADLGELTNGTNTVDLKIEASGVYFIRFTDGSKTAIKKIILN